MESAETVSSKAQIDRSAQSARGEIAIVAFDDASQFDFGIVKFNDLPAQTLLAQAIERIERCKPTLVAVDLDLRGAASPELISVFRHYRNVVLALFGTSITNPALPAPEFINHAAGYGYGGLTAEANGMVCRLPINFRGKLHKRSEAIAPIPSFTEAILDEHRQFKGVGPDSDFLASQADRPLYINFANQKYNQVTFVDLLKANIDPQTFKDKIVIVGSTLTSRLDEEPYMKTPGGTTVPSVEIEADALSSILSNQIIAALPPAASNLLIVLLGTLLGALSAILPMRKRIILFLGTGTFLVIACQIAFQAFFLAPPVVPLLAVTLSAFILGTLIFLDSDLRLRNKELADARQAMQARAEEERKRIAEDLHDETLPALSTVARLADRIALEVPESELPKQMRTQLDDALSEMRRVINDLHPSVLETMGFLPALENLLNIAASDSNIETRYLNNTASSLHLNEFTQLQLYRIVQEALNNVKKHACASIVELAISENEGKLEISVADNGKGLSEDLLKRQASRKDLSTGDLTAGESRGQSPGQSPGNLPGSSPVNSHGLLNIRQRAQLIGATINLGKPDHFASGLQVTVILTLTTDNQTGNLS